MSGAGCPGARHHAVAGRLGRTRRRVLLPGQTPAVDRALVTAVERVLGTGVARGVPLRGGDVAVAYGVELVDGRRVFVKTHRAPPSGFFSTEAAGLAWIREAGAVDVPSVLAVSDEVPSLLVLSWIERGTARGVTEQDLGRRLAALHRAGAPCFGRQDGRTTGSRALPNDPATTWAEFYGTCRLLPLARLAADAGALGASDDRSAAGARRSAGRRRWSRRATGAAAR